DLQSFGIFGEFSLYLWSFGIFLGSSAFCAFGESWFLRSFSVLVNFLGVFGILVFRRFGEFSWDLWSSMVLGNFLSLRRFDLQSFGEFSWDLWSSAFLVNFLRVFGVLVKSWFLRSFSVLVNFLGVFGVLNLWSSAVLGNFLSLWHFGESFGILVNFLRVFGVLVFQHFGEFSWDLWSSAVLENFLRVFGVLSFGESSWYLRSSAFLVNFLRVFGILGFRCFGEFYWVFSLSAVYKFELVVFGSFGVSVVNVVFLCFIGEFSCDLRITRKFTSKTLKVVVCWV
ncbi:1910_t:CDS:10, partial [Dentiscutata heterogama]